jgi:hypothetical protein
MTFWIIWNWTYFLRPYLSPGNNFITYIDHLYGFYSSNLFIYFLNSLFSLSEKITILLKVNNTKKGTSHIISSTSYVKLHWRLRRYKNQIKRIHFVLFNQIINIKPLDIYLPEFWKSNPFHFVKHDLKGMLKCIEIEICTPSPWTW